MSKVVNFGFVDTPIDGVTSLNLPRGLVNFGADHRVLSDKGNEMILTNITSPIDRPEKFRHAWTVIDDIYKGKGISGAYQAPSTKGISLLTQLTEVVSVTDTTDVSYRVDAPISYHIVVVAPAIEEITAEHIQAGVGRLISGFYETGSIATSRIKAELRGSLKPLDL